ncbi:hypothetical protein EG68_05087 [Paragonimus skrjabini miyazakii]|uniref:Uncharacterized protein n=1 Tax=Paragonimus skrjabini miyazakii TaxID=59628 RepID=A0A8S9Z2B4_9TREM|nr:hypothetical protein EG68_05087 [Paragonimus skrjabini miyazakii]
MSVMQIVDLTRPNPRGHSCLDSVPNKYSNVNRKVIIQLCLGLIAAYLNNTVHKPTLIIIG